MDDKNVKKDSDSTKRLSVKQGSLAERCSPEDLAYTKKIKIVPPSQSAAAKTQKPASPPKKKLSKEHRSILFVTSIFVCILAVVFTFAMILNRPEASENGVEEDPPPIETPYPDDPQPPDYNTHDTDDTGVAIGLIREISHSQRSMVVYVFEDSYTLIFSATNDTVIRSRFGNTMDFSGFSLGDVVEVGYISGSYVMESARVSPQVMTYTNIRHVAVNTSNQTLTIGNRQYNYSTQTIVQHRGVTAEVEELSPVDTMNISIFRDFVVFVDILQGSGTLHIPHNDLIIQGAVEVGGVSRPLSLTGSTDIRVSEGAHQVTIRGTNIQPFIHNFTIYHGENHIVSLDDVRLLMGELTVVVDDPYAVLTIDDEIFEANEIIPLDYGTYFITVEREGFITFEEEIVIDSPEMEIVVVLEPIEAEEETYPGQDDDADPSQPSAQSRHVAFTTNPPGARIYLNGHFIGVSPVEVPLQFGLYDLVATRPGYSQEAMRINVSDHTPNFHFDLESDDD